MLNFIKSFKTRLVILIIEVVFGAIVKFYCLINKGRVSKEIISLTQIYALTVKKSFRPICPSRVYTGLRYFFKFSHDLSRDFSFDSLVSCLRLSLALTKMGYKPKVSLDFILSDSILGLMLVEVIGSVSCKGTFMVNGCLQTKKVLLQPKNFRSAFTKDAVIFVDLH